MKNMPLSAVKSYKNWISMFPEIWSESDLERFYIFVHIVLSNSRKKRTGSWLRANLLEDCSKLALEDIDEYCELFDRLRNFTFVHKSNQAKLIAQSIHEENMKEARKKYG